MFICGLDRDGGGGGGGDDRGRDRDSDCCHGGDGVLGSWPLTMKKKKKLREKKRVTNVAPFEAIFSTSFSWELNGWTIALC